VSRGEEREELLGERRESLGHVWNHCNSTVLKYMEIPWYFDPKAVWLVFATQSF